MIVSCENLTVPHIDLTVDRRGFFQRKASRCLALDDQFLSGLLGQLYFVCIFRVAVV